jgi:arginyl-tRNA synthetase
METIKNFIQRIILDLYNQNIDVELTRTDPQFGDFATNCALQLGKKMKKNPRDVANEIVSALQQQSHDEIHEVTVAGPGFINIRISDHALLISMNAHSTKSRNGLSIVIETNNPNPFKAMHIGHAFNAILGDTIANLIEESGAHTHRVSYHGDVGSHVGKSMYSLLRFINGDIRKLTSIPKNERNSFMSKMYAEGAKAYKENEAAKTQIDELAKQSFTREDLLYAEVYELCKAWSFEQIDEIVAMLGNKPIERRFLESEADCRGVEIVKSHVPDIFQESDGALIFPGSLHGSFDNVYVSARGLGLYGARDLGLMKLKQEAFHPDKSYIVTAEEQRAYFIGVLAAADLCMPERKGSTVNISTGMVKLPTGKMSSRSGDVVEISWLFDQIADAIRERDGDASDQFIAGVLRYQFLKVRIGSDVVFNIHDAASIEGNSGPYLQYAHARARSILQKSKAALVQTVQILEADERTLVLKLTEYYDVISRAIDDLTPHIICTYLYELSQQFNRFYENNRVIGDPRESERLYLVKSYAEILKSGLDILGIYAPEKM